MDLGKGVRVLEEAEGNRVPSEEEVNEYANFLEIDIENESHLMWIAREGVVAPVPHPWKMCTENDEDFFYFNFETGESVWDHPCDEKYRAMVEEHRAKPAGKTGGATSGGDSLESGMTSKLDSKLDASVASVTSPTSLPLPGDTPVKEEKDSKLEVSRDGSAKDEICKFEQDSALNSSVASAAGVNVSKGSPVVEKGKLTEASSESSASSDGISGPASPKSVASDASASRSGAVETMAEKSKEQEDVKSPVAGGALGKDARSPGMAGIGQSPSPSKVSSIDATPQRGLLEASGADVVVDLAEESVTSASASMTSPLTSPTGAALGKTSSSKSPSSAADAGAGSSPKRGGDDAAGHASSEAAVKGWQNIVGKAAEEASKKEEEEREKREAEKEKEKREAENERAEKEKAEKERAEKEKAEKERAEKEKAEKERAEKEKAERERAEKEKAEKEREEKERAEREREEKEKAESRRLEQQSQAAASPEQKPRGVVGLGGTEDAPSEVSEEYPSEFAATSPAASHSGVLGGRASPRGGTPELAAATAADPEDPTSPTAAEQAPRLGRTAGAQDGAAAATVLPAVAGVGEGKQSLQTWAQVEVELASLSRCLSMLRDVREKQAKFLQVLHG